MRVRHKNAEEIKGEVVELLDGGFVVLWSDGKRLPYAFGDEVYENIIWER